VNTLLFAIGVFAFFSSIYVWIVSPICQAIKAPKIVQVEISPTSIVYNVNNSASPK
jgi:S-adenosylmethionine synthetase